MQLFPRTLLIALIALVATVALQAPAPARAEPVVDGAGASYYIDATGGDDDATGRSPDAAWQSLAKVGATTFQPGDRILLKAGERWTGQLWPKGSGTAAAPITIDRYGAGAKPRLDGRGEVGDVVRLFNQEYWSIRNLEITNAVPATQTPGENLRDLRGIHVSGDNSQTLDGFVIDAVDVHDVTGEVNWIGGSVSGNAPGVRFQTGWDGSKKTGGIVFDTSVPDIHAPPTTPTILNDVLVQNSTVSNTSFAGIVVKQYTGDGRNAAGETIATATGWGTRTNATDPRFAPHTGIVIRGNFITQAATDHGCNGIYLTDVRGAVVERNVVYRAGTSGIETYYSDDVTIQFNEVYETTAKAGGADSNGIDPDKGTTRHIVQYNYVHGNGDGILLCQFVFGDVIVRENVLASNRRYPIYLHSDRAASAKIYHNTIYNDRSDYLVYGYGSSLAATYDLTDNVFYSTRAGAALSTSSTIRYDSNLYGGAALDVPDDTRAVVGDPMFTDPSVDGPYGTATTGPQLATAYAFRPRAASPAIDGGMAVAGNGGRDYAGSSALQRGTGPGRVRIRDARRGHHRNRGRHRQGHRGRPRRGGDRDRRNVGHRHHRSERVVRDRRDSVRRRRHRHGGPQRIRDRLARRGRACRQPGHRTPHTRVDQRRRRRLRARPGPGREAPRRRSSHPARRRPVHRHRNQHRGRHVH